MIDLKTELTYDAITSGGDIAAGMRLKIMEDVATTLNVRFQQTFEDQKGTEGPAWAANDISERTKKKKGSTKIMVDKGHMRGSQWDYTFSEMAAIVGSGADYAQKHNLGTVQFPARYFAWISDSILTIIEKTVKWSLEN